MKDSEVGFRARGSDIKRFKKKKRKSISCVDQGLAAVQSLQTGLQVSCLWHTLCTLIIDWLGRAVQVEAHGERGRKKHERSDTLVHGLLCRELGLNN